MVESRTGVIGDLKMQTWHFAPSPRSRNRRLQTFNHCTPQYIAARSLDVQAAANGRNNRSLRELTMSKGGFIPACI